MIRSTPAILAIYLEVAVRSAWAHAFFPSRCGAIFGSLTRYSQVLSQILPAFSKYDDMKSHFRSIYLSAIFTAVVAL